MASVEIPIDLHEMAAGRAEVDVDAPNLLAALEELDRHHPGISRSLRQGRSVVVDGTLHPRVTAVPLEASSVVRFVASVAGG